MFFRRKSLTLESIHERLCVVEDALRIGQESPRVAPVSRGSLEAALARLGRSVADEARKSTQQGR